METDNLKNSLGKLKLNIEDLNKKSQDYIINVFKIIRKKIGLKRLTNLTLFGSQVPQRKDNKSISDCDLLIIVSNHVSKSIMRECEKYISALEIKHKFREANDNLPKKVLFAIQKSTGMFVSHFLTYESHFRKLLFHKMFEVNRVFSLLFAPRKIVTNNVIDSNKTLYGVPINRLIERPKIPTWEILKSLVMNLMISFFSLLISPFRSLNAIKYQLEAVKWSLRTFNYYVYEDTVILDKIIKRYLAHGNNRKFKQENRFFNTFLNLRNCISDDMWFMMRSPIHILKIHRNATLFRKKFK